MFTSEPELVALSQPDFWAVVKPLIWRGSDGFNTTIPVGFKTDLASIPAVLRNIFDVDGRSRSPAILHDWLYATQHTTKAFADKQLYNALVAYGDKRWQASLYYWGVRLGGHEAWVNHTRHAVPFDTVANYRAWIRSGGVA